ncbi:metallo-beta-lactamase protein [Candidatus Caldarchaeum subterraneum]|uniref:Metallo-beta-lactamase protein n=1 Tax=Caldiarchaeum subterraneum TaxID=311458 RepID=E6N771_CALS0|nr:metallo-beta-lactamase protein [Candidatus Caldarchaeum subterraneum]BAJ50894.1 metallo-beta-lactamase protein [Candidatus Caldarchaeum subterraneum]
MRVSEKVYLIDTRALGFEKIVACYLVMGRKTALVDAGYSSTADVVINALKEMGVTRLDYIIPTHVHLDHSGAVWRLAEHFKEAEVIAHQRAVKHLVDPSKLVASVLEVYGPDILQVFGEVKPVEEHRVHSAADGETLVLGDVELTFIYTPGHAPHQFTVAVSDGSVITADAVPIKYPGKPFIIPSTPPPSFDLNQFIDSLAKLGKLGSTIFHTPHFGSRETDESHVDFLLEKTREFVAVAEKAYRQGAGVGGIYMALERKLETEAGEKLPIYAQNLVKISSMGLYDYFRKNG